MEQVFAISKESNSERKRHGFETLKALMQCLVSTFIKFEDFVKFMAGSNSEQILENI